MMFLKNSHYNGQSQAFPNVVHPLSSLFHGLLAKLKHLSYDTFYFNMSMVPTFCRKQLFYKGGRYGLKPAL